MSGINNLEVMYALLYCMCEFPTLGDSDTAEHVIKTLASLQKTLFVNSDQRHLKMPGKSTRNSVLETIRCQHGDRFRGLGYKHGGA